MHKENPLHRHTMYDFKTHVSAACSYRTFLLTTERKHFILYKKHVVGHRRRTKPESERPPFSPEPHRFPTMVEGGRRGLSWIAVWTNQAFSTYFC